MTQTTYRPSGSLRARIAPTEVTPPRGYPLQGEVHDENAYALGGVAGHAGLFSTASDIAVFAQLMLNGGSYNGVRVVSDSAVRLFTRRTAGTRALGWDTCAGNGGCGQYLSERAFGHTGYTGTSLWIDPDREMFVVLLTNRVHAARARRPAKVISDVRADLADAAALAVMDGPSEVLAMPAYFRADRAEGWNPTERREVRRSRSARGSRSARARAAKARTAKARASSGRTVKGKAVAKAGERSTASKSAAGKSTAAKTSKAKSGAVKARSGSPKAKSVASKAGSGALGLGLRGAADGAPERSPNGGPHHAGAGPRFASRAGYLWRMTIPGAAMSDDIEPTPAGAPAAASEPAEIAPAAEGVVSVDQAKLALRRVKDPELNLNIVDLGLVYDVRVEGSVIDVDMSLTSPGCPSGPEIMGEAEQQLRTLPGVENVRMNLVWSPIWTPERIEPRVRAYLGF
jgi:metal-sulfur cluster biosynthetic enzyme